MKRSTDDFGNPRSGDRTLLEVVSHPLFNHRRLVHVLLLVAAVCAIEYAPAQFGTEMDVVSNAPVVLTVRDSFRAGAQWVSAAARTISASVNGAIEGVGDAVAEDVAAAKAAVAEREVPGWLRAAYTRVRGWFKSRHNGSAGSNASEEGPARDH